MFPHFHFCGKSLRKIVKFLNVWYNSSVMPSGTNSFNITEDVRNIPKIPEKILDKKVRMKKWFDSSPFNGMLDYSDQKNIELQCASGVEGGTSLKMIRCGVRMHHDLAKLVLNKSRMGCSREDFVYICFESEVKKLNKNACKRWLACINTKSYQEKIALANSSSRLVTSRSNEDIAKALQIAIEADINAQPTPKRAANIQTVLHEVNETYVPFALITASPDHSLITMTTDLDTLNRLLFKPSDEVTRYIRAQDEWLTIVGLNPFVNVCIIHNLQLCVPFKLFF